MKYFNGYVLSIALVAALAAPVAAATAATVIASHKIRSPLCIYDSLFVSNVTVRVQLRSKNVAV